VSLADEPGVGQAAVIDAVGEVDHDAFSIHPNAQWQVLVLIPVIGVAVGFIGLRLYERLLSRREAEKVG